MRPGDDDDSPWARDDWTSEPAATTPAGPDGSSTATSSLRDAIPPAPASASPSSEPPPSPPPTSSRTFPLLLGGLAVAAMIAVIAVIAVISRSGSGDGTDPDATPAGGSSDTQSADTVGDAVAVATTPRGASEPTVPATTLGRAGGTAVPRPAGLVAGRAPDWTEWRVEVPEPLASLAEPTEVVAVSNDRVLHRIEFPSGRVRSIDLADRGADASVEVGPDAIVVHGGTEMMVIRDDRPLEEVSVPDGIALVQSWPGTGGFLVITPALSDSAPAQAWTLDGDSNLERLDDGPFASAVLSSFRNSYLPSGELLVGRPGGVYALSPDAAPRRVSTGDLVAGGSTHYAVVECDEVLRCEHWLVDATTGDRRAAPLDPVGTLGWDPSTRIGPGGQHVVFRDYFRGTGVRMVLDTATGSAFDIGRVTSIFDPDTWAADGSGLFLAGEGLRFQVASTGEAATFDDFGRVSSITTRPAV